MLTRKETMTNLGVFIAIVCFLTPWFVWVCGMKSYNAGVAAGFSGGLLTLVLLLWFVGVFLSNEK